jgi:hypothetical protein
VAGHTVDLWRARLGRWWSGPELVWRQRLVCRQQAGEPGGQRVEVHIEVGRTLARTGGIAEGLRNEMCQEC